MNLRKFVPACDDSPVRVLTTVSLRLGSWPLLLVAPRPRLVPPNATARASVSFQSNARTSFSVTPSRRIRSRIAVSSNSSSRDGSVQHLLNIISSHHSSAIANRMSVNSMTITGPATTRPRRPEGADKSPLLVSLADHQEFTSLVQRRLRVL